MLWDCIVLGLGSMGASACYHLASRGQKVLGIEQFDLVHERGSHGGQSRIIRQAYFEHPDYIPLLRRAYDNWAQLEQISGQKIYHRSGLLYAGPRGHAVTEQVKQSAAMYQIPLEELSAKECQWRFPSFHIPPGYDILYEPDAGYLLPDVAIRGYAKAAITHGAQLQTHEQVLDWKVENDLVSVITNRGTYHSKKLVITAGAWAARVIPCIDRHLHITRQVLAWYALPEPAAFTGKSFPCWMIAHEDAPGIYYGFPVMDPGEKGIRSGLKIAYHYPGKSCDPDDVERSIDREDILHLERVLQQYVPDGNGPLLDATTCLYSNSPDEHFVIDHLPGTDGRVAVAWGFSGHGFKFASLVGEVLADLAIRGQTDHPIGFLHAGRFHNEQPEF